MRVLVYEYVTGGGLWSARSSAPPSDSLWREGAAMIEALAADFVKLPGVDVMALRDRRRAAWRLPGCAVTEIGGAAEEGQSLSRLAATADWTVLIAPETGGALRERSLWVRAAGGRLLSPGPALVELASDKHRTGLRLAAAGVATPDAILLRGGHGEVESFPYPAVVKPRFGAGSLNVQLVDGPEAVRPWVSRGEQMRLERHCEGVGASVAFLCGAGRQTALPASRQRLSVDGRYRYLGGATPLAEPLARRAETLARSALRALPPALGYVGVDLVLGREPDGSGDAVIEVNPRLTTSYVGLRKLARVNLAEAMLAIAERRPFEVSFTRDRVVFDADGTVNWE